MLVFVRRQLRRIRYYSAAREQTRWSRAADRVFFVSFALALPVAILANAFIARPFVTDSQEGMFVRDRAGEPTALFMETAHPVGGWPASAFGRFKVTAIEEHRGWPVITSTSHRPARLEYRMFHEAEPRVDAGAQEDAPLREAVANAVEQSGYETLLHSWRRDSATAVPRSPLHWLVAMGMWWVLLYVAGMAALSTVRLVAFVHERLERARVRKLTRLGKCTNCGYDMRGCEFSERCPECGELA